MAPGCGCRSGDTVRRGVGRASDRRLGAVRRECRSEARPTGWSRVGRASAGGTVFVMGETRPRICGVKTVQWTVFRVERPRMPARAGGRCGWGSVVGRGLGRCSGEGESGQAPTYGCYGSTGTKIGTGLLTLEVASRTGSKSHGNDRRKINKNTTKKTIGTARSVSLNGRCLDPSVPRLRCFHSAVYGAHPMHSSSRQITANFPEFKSLYDNMFRSQSRQSETPHMATMLAESTSNSSGLRI